MKGLFLVILIIISNTFALAQKGEIECVRAIPVPILKKSVFPKKTFTLITNKENSGEKIGTEIVKLNKNTKLTILNSGCEYYTLTFRYELNGFSHNSDDAKFWFRKVIELMTQIKKGVRSSDKGLIDKGTNALIKTRNPKFEKDIDFGGLGVKEIRNFVFINKPIKQGRDKYQLEVSYSIGPL